MPGILLNRKLKTMTRVTFQMDIPEALLSKSGKHKMLMIVVRDDGEAEPSELSAGHIFIDGTWVELPVSPTPINPPKPPKIEWLLNFLRDKLDDFPGMVFGLKVNLAAGEVKQVRDTVSLEGANLHVPVSVASRQVQVRMR